MISFQFVFVSSCMRSGLCVRACVCVCVCVCVCESHVLICVVYEPVCGSPVIAANGEQEGDYSSENICTAANSLLQNVPLQ